MGKAYQQVVYLLQGGGALGAYQGGVCQSLIENNVSPDWVIGTSIGGINSAIIAGNPPEDRIDKLKTFWERVTYPIASPWITPGNVRLQRWQSYWCALNVMTFGVPGFFSPKIMNPWFENTSSPDKISFYDTTALKNTLEELIDFDLINQKKIRLTLSAVDVDKGDITYFDNAYQPIDVRHVMASGALPPGFPAINIEGTNYWDGGISSNTPLAYILQEKISKEILCFMIDLFSNQAESPQTLPEVLKRKKDLEYADRYQQMIKYFCEVHRLRHALREILTYHEKNNIQTGLKKIHLDPPSSLNLVRFLYRDRPYEIWSKDFEFSHHAIAEHWSAGFNDSQKAFENSEWLQATPDKDSGVSVHSF